MATKTRNRAERESKPRPKSDAYTGLLVISLLAMITACVLWYVDYDSFGKAAPPKPQVAAPGQSTPPPIPTAPPASETPATPPKDETPATPMPMPPMGSTPPMGPPNMPMPPMGSTPPTGKPPMGPNMPMPPAGRGTPMPPKGPSGM